MVRLECGITIRQSRKLNGLPLSPSDFVSRPGACENLNSFLSLVEIPKHLISPEQAKKAKQALDDCQKVVGGWGERQSKFDSQEFKEAAARFKKATGVEAKDVFVLLYDQFTS